MNGWCDGGGAALVSSGGGRPERCPAGAGTPAGVAGGGGLVNALMLCLHRGVIRLRPCERVREENLDWSQRSSPPRTCDPWFAFT